MKFSEKLFEFRVEHNLSQLETAKILGVDRTSIVHYENEKTNPTRRNAALMEKKMAEYERGAK